MRRRTALATVPLALAGCVQEASEVLSGPDAAEAEGMIRDGINDLRFEQGVPDVHRDELLGTVAREHSRDMAAREFYAHRNPDGESPSDRAGCAAGEVIHRGEIGEMRLPGGEETYQTALTDGLARFCLDAWRQSNDHRKILIDPKYSSLGVGIHTASGEFFATVVFC